MNSRTVIKQKISLVLNLAIVVMELMAAYQSFSRNGTGMFRFFTEDSNLLALAACAVCAAATIWALKSPRGILFTGYRTSIGVRKIPGWVYILKYMATVCLALTFIVVIAVLAPVMGGINGYKTMLLSDSMLFHHLLCPILAFVSFVFFENEHHFKKRTALIAVMPVCLYAAIFITLNAKGIADGPYMFLKVNDQPIYMSVIWFAAIVGGAFMLALGLGRLNRKNS
ncbi:MAG: hypothetical protein VB031_07075 [Eubacteriaceae bacterium]|nr:hypothetical protein [Eubacteriaceae bacterium]